MKVDIMNVLALAMCGLALFALIVVYHATRLLVALGGMAGNIFLGLLILGAAMLAASSLYQAAALSEFSATGQIIAVLLGFVFDSLALMAGVESADAAKADSVSVRVAVK